MINREFVKRKLALIQDDLTKLSEFKSFTLDEVVADDLKQAALERWLERIITRAIDVNQHLIKELTTSKSKESSPKDYRATFVLLADLGIYPKEFANEISKSVGTRNILVHEYDNIDQALVYGSMADCVRDYTVYVDHLLAYLDKQK